MTQYFPKFFLFILLILSTFILFVLSKEIDAHIGNADEYLESVFPLKTTTIPKNIIGQVSLKEISNEFQKTVEKDTTLTSDVTSSTGRDSEDASNWGGFVFPLKRVLLVTTPAMKSSHSQFINELRDIVKGNGFGSLKIKNVHEVERLELYGEYLYDAIVLLLPENEQLVGPLRTQNLLSFMDSGRNLFIAASSVSVSNSIKEAAFESGLEFASDDTQLHDYFHTVDHRFVYTNAVNPKIIRDKINAPILYKGLTMSSTGKSPLIVPILKGESTSFSKKTNGILKESLKCMGDDCLLVAGVQGRNGARITFVASSDVLSDELFNAEVDGKKSGNSEFTKQLLLWSLGKRGVLRFRRVNSYAEGEDLGKHMYSVHEHVLFSVIIEEYDGVKNTWIPYIADDIQLEFTMLDPYYRIPLKYFPQNGTYTAHFQVPDKYGVFKFVVDYRRQGYTPLVFETQQTVRPYRLDQYERFIPAAYPYYVSMFSSMIGFLFVGILVLYSSFEKKEDEKVKKD